MRSGQQSCCGVVVDIGLPGFRGRRCRVLVRGQPGVQIELDVTYQCLGSA